MGRLDGFSLEMEFGATRSNFFYITLRPVWKSQLQKIKYHEYCIEKHCS